MTLRLGPGAMVAAAFIGPGTLTTAATTGASSGLALAWTILFALIATVTLQELAVRSALATQRDLAPLAREFGGAIWGRWLVAPLIVAAIGVGNAAYQSGNLSGAAVGLTAFTPDRFACAVLSLTAVAVILILGNRYHWLERVLVALVVLMAVLFFGLAIILAPEILSLSADRLGPRFSSGDSLLVLALIGTTIVPYNLFLHATAARRRWQDAPLSEALREARWESFVAISMGAMITLAIMAVAAVLLESPSNQSVL
ncbi:MAG: Nramp family divalent metal transporter, partial [Halieaceae bacterium]